jgi:hypothetical protein
MSLVLSGSVKMFAILAVPETATRYDLVVLREIGHEDTDDQEAELGG